MITESARRRITVRWLLLTAVLAAAGAAVGFLVAAGPGGRSLGSARQFPDLVPAPAPAGWRSDTLPSGDGVLAYPPSLHPVRGDAGSASAARFGRGGSYLLYLNATPREGTENLGNWPRLRLRLLRSDDASTAHEIASASNVRFRGGTGSCILDSYVTKIGAHHYTELACFVQGKSSASVVVAAAPAARWTASAPLLERAVAAYQVR
ncbi:MAG: hypothetical protein ACLQFR_25280 [Streptosporangiaceae bacterium]